MTENELGGTKDDTRGMIRTNDGDATSEEMKARAFDARNALIEAGHDPLHGEDAEDVVAAANRYLEGEF